MEQDLIQRTKISSTAQKSHSLNQNLIHRSKSHSWNMISFIEQKSHSLNKNLIHRIKIPFILKAKWLKIHDFIYKHKILMNSWSTLLIKEDAISMNLRSVSLNPEFMLEFMLGSSNCSLYASGSLWLLLIHVCTKKFWCIHCPVFSYHESQCNISMSHDASVDHL